MAKTKSERLSIIVELLREKGAVKNSDLCMQLQTSDMTIRRDIDELERAGILQRVHGGAVDVKASAYIESSINERVFENTYAKEKIAEKAISLLHTNDRILLDSGSTGYIVAKQLARGDTRLFCITSAINTAAEMAKSDYLKVILIGGEIKGKAMCSIGSLAESQIRSYHVSVSLLACNGIDAEGNVMLLDIGERGIKRAAMEAGERKYLLCDSSKIGRPSLIEFAHVSEFDGIIADKGIPPDLKKSFEDRGAHIIVAD